LMTARSTVDVRNVRDQIFIAEQSRWVTPGVSILKTNSHDAVGIKRIQQKLAPSTLLLEYVMADPVSYCLVISRTTSRIVRLSSKAKIEPMVADYLKAVKAKQPALTQGRRLHAALLGPVPESSRNKNLVIVRDGQLHLVPFDGLREVSGRYIFETRNVIYAPSATTFYLLAQQGQRARGTRDAALLAVGGVPYSGSAVNKTGLARGDDRGGFPNLPSSIDEVYAAQAALGSRGNKLLLGTAATEAAFKRADLPTYRIIHLAVHGFADSSHPDRASVVMLSDGSAGEDGFLQSSEIVRLRFNADLIVLSACDTAVGPLQGQDGIANLSRAFLLAGARNVVSTLWQIDDSSSLFLMKRFYAHLAAGKSAASALTASKRDMLRTFGRKTLPYQWAAFTIEGAAGQAIPLPKKERYAQ
jgi:CHAT domain-containing protein